jgi:hypothetical protein
VLYCPRDHPLCGRSLGAAVTASERADIPEALAGPAAFSRLGPATGSFRRTYTTT